MRAMGEIGNQMDPLFFTIQDFYSWLKMVVAGPNSILILVGTWCDWCTHNTTCISKEKVQLYSVVLKVKNLTSLLCHSVHDQ